MHARTHARTHAHTHTHTHVHISSFLVQPDEVDWTKNLALGKPTRQSTTQGNGKPSKAVDGNRNSEFDSSSCTHTKSKKGSWWQVDLEAVYEIRDVVITNRGDCCGKLNQTRSMCVNATRTLTRTPTHARTHAHAHMSIEKSFSFLAEFRLKGFVIEVLRGRNIRRCASVAGQLKKSETRRISCMPGAIGNIVKIRMTNKEAQKLTLCEVEVFGISGKTKCC